MIFLDSWIWIEFFTEGKESEQIDKILESIDKGLAATISTAVLTEIKYMISKRFGIEKSDSVLYKIESIPNLKIVPVVAEVAKLAADLRLKYYSKERQISYFDCINLATAIITGCKKFYTADPDFKGIDEIEVEII